MTSRNPFDERARAADSGAIATSSADSAGIIRTEEPIRALIAATGLVSLAQNSEILGAEILAPEDGWIEELVLGAQAKSDQVIARWSLHLKLQTPPRSEAIATDGSGPAYVPFAALYDDSRPRKISIFLKQGQRLVIDVKNLDLAANTYTPSITARFRPSSD